MLFSTTGQYAVLALVLVAGWFLGLASHSGGRRWRERYAAERDAHASYRKDTDARLAESRREADARIAEAERQRADLERDHSRLASAAPVTAATVAPTAATTTGVRTERSAFSPETRVIRPTGSVRPKSGWFDWR